MSYPAKIYIGYALVFIVSIALPHLLPPTDLTNYAATATATIALTAGIFQMLRDQAIHDRTLLLTEASNRFSLGVSSHMANIAFDKHILFCEAYVAEMQKTLLTLMREGPRGSALTQAHELYNIQEKYRLWLTPEIEEELEIFEKALREIGAGAGFVEAVRGSSNQDDGVARAKTNARIYEVFSKVIGLPVWNEQKLTDELTTTAIIQQLRAVLGIPALAALRKAILEKAIKSAPFSDQTYGGSSSVQPEGHVG